MASSMPKQTLESFLNNWNGGSMQSPRVAAIRQLLGLVMMGAIAVVLIHRGRYDGGLFIASLILQQLGMRHDVVKAVQSSVRSENYAKSASESGEFAVVALQKLTGAQRARLNEGEDFEVKESL